MWAPPRCDGAVCTLAVYGDCGMWCAEGGRGIPRRYCPACRGSGSCPAAAAACPPTGPRPGCPALPAPAPTPPSQALPPTDTILNRLHCNSDGCFAAGAAAEAWHSECASFTSAAWWPWLWGEISPAVREGFNSDSSSNDARGRCKRKGVRECREENDAASHMPGALPCFPDTKSAGRSTRVCGVGGRT